MKTKIYTKSGDSGLTSLFGGSRVPKSSLQLCAYGSVDELNAALGCALSHIHKFSTSNESNAAFQTLKKTQNELFKVGSLLALGDAEFEAKLPQVTTESIFHLESEIDAMTEKLPELKEFILPGGHIAASHLHLARTVCRRSERAIVEYFASEPVLSKSSQNMILQYLNRLGDYLFVAARYFNFINSHPEEKWQK